MKKRSLALCMAAGLIASLAFATPSQAGSVVVTTDVTFTLTGPNSPTITDFVIQYSPVPMPDMTAPVIVGGMDGGIGAMITSFNPALSQVEVSFGAVGATTSTIEFQFSTSADPKDIGGTLLSLSGLMNGPVTHQTFLVNVSTVPEPATLGLLGIGMTGFLAFRRFFKKTSVA